MLKKIFIAVFVIFIFLMAPYIMIFGSNKKSTFENRTLQQSPILSIKNIISAKYMSEFENYFTDQFPGRDVWVKMYLKYQKAVNKTFIFNYYVTKDNWIMPKPITRFPKRSIDKAFNNLEKINQIAKKQGTRLIFISLPHKVNSVKVNTPSYIQKDRGLEDKAYMLNKIKNSSVELLDVGSEIKKRYSQEQINQMYFKTDHHWNISGAFAGLKIISNYLNLNFNDKNYIEKCYRDKVFQGSYNLQLYMMVSAKNEVICTKVPKDNSFKALKITINKKNVPIERVYARVDFLKKKNIQYKELFTNDYSEIKIKNPLAKNNKKIIISKDSYTNPIVFHIAQQYKEADVVDLRHYKYKSFERLLKDNKFDYALIMYDDDKLSGPTYEFQK
jgi:hypothetical protein